MQQFNAEVVVPQDNIPDVLNIEMDDEEIGICEETSTQALEELPSASQESIQQEIVALAAAVDDTPG
jgi:hypothetical protein